MSQPLVFRAAARAEFDKATAWYGHWYDEPGQLRTDVIYLLQARAEPAG
jgi:hypothetical protein